MVKVCKIRPRIFNLECLNALSVAFTGASRTFNIFTHAFEQCALEVVSRNINPIILKILFVRTSFSDDCLHDKRLSHW